MCSIKLKILFILIISFTACREQYKEKQYLKVTDTKLSIDIKR